MALRKRLGDEREDGGEREEGGGKEEWTEGGDIFRPGFLLPCT